MFQVGKDTPSPNLNSKTPAKGLGSINLDFGNSNELILPIE